MSDYTKTTNFTAKDALPSGDPNKKILGSLFDTEFDNLQTSNNTKANKLTSVTATNNLLKTSAGGDLVEAVNIRDDGTNINIDNKLLVGSGGTANYFLNIFGAASEASVHYTNTTTGTTSSSGMKIGIQAAGTGILWHYGAYDMLFATSSVERIRINSGGNVSIGGSSSPDNFKLNLYESSSSNCQIQFINSTTGTTTTDGTRIGLTSGEGFDIWNYETTEIRFATDNSERMRITAAGLVGIGVSSPSVQLHVHENSATDSFMLFTNTSTGTTSSDGFHVGIGSSGNAFLMNKENTALIFRTNNTERIRIDADGGIYTNGATGGSQGAGTINASGYYVDGTALGNHIILTTPVSLLSSGSPTTGAWTTINDATIAGYAPKAIVIKARTTNYHVSNSTSVSVYLRETSSGLSTNEATKVLESHAAAGGTGADVNTHILTVDQSGYDFDYYVTETGSPTTRGLYLYLVGYIA